MASKALVVAFVLALISPLFLDAWLTHRDVERITQMLERKAPLRSIHEAAGRFDGEKRLSLMYGFMATHANKEQRQHACNFVAARLTSDSAWAYWQRLSYAQKACGRVASPEELAWYRQRKAESEQSDSSVSITYNPRNGQLGLSPGAPGTLTF